VVNVNVTTTVGDLVLDGDADDAADGNDSIAFAANVTLLAGGNLSLSATTGGMTGAGVLNLLANGHVTVNDNLTVNGVLTAIADANSDEVGTFTVAAGKTVDSSGNAMSITGADIALDGFLNAGGGTVTLRTTSLRTMGIGNVAAIGPAGAQWGLSNTELSHITAGDLVIGASSNSFANGDITVDGVSLADIANITGTITLQALAAGHVVTFSGGASTFKTLLALASDGVAVNTNLTTTTSPLFINADTNADNTGTFSTAFGTTVFTNSQLLSITAADVALLGALNSGTALTEILNSTLGRQIDLGTNTAGKLSLTDAELDLITAGTLHIGRNDAVASGQITVSDVVSPGGTTRLHLFTGSGIGTTGLGAIVETNLALSAVGAVSLMNANDVDNIAALLTGPGLPFAFQDVDGLTIASVDGVVGVTTSGGNITLQLGGLGNQQAGADINGAGLELLGAGSFVFLNATNEVTRIAANTGGPISYRDATDLIVGVVNGTVGVTTAGSNVFLEAGGSLFLNQAIAAPAAIVSLQSDAEGIVDGNGSATNITAGSLLFQAVAGIGSSDDLETSVSLLAANNTASGNIQVFNTVAGVFVIGTVNGVTGIQNSGGGFILITNSGAMTVNGAVLNTGGGDITLTSLPDPTSNDLTLNAVVRAIDGGNINFNAGTDLLINDSGVASEVQTDDNGLITGIAQGFVVFGPNVAITTGAGQITTLVPALDNVDAPQLENTGKVTVTGTYGDPGAHSYQFTIDWGDGTIEVFDSKDFPELEFPGTFAFTHVYAANPDPTNQAAPIPIRVTVVDDRNSTFDGLQQQAATFPINPTDFKTIAEGFDSVLTFTNSPGEGFASVGIFRLDTTVQITQRFFPPVTPLLYTFDVVGLSSIDSGGFGREAPTYLEAVIEARQVLLVTVNPQGVESDPVVLDEGVLDDLPGLFRRLPDGHYRIYLREIGEQRVRLLIDVNLRGGKPADDSETGQDKPPTAAAEIDDTGVRTADRERSVEAVDHVAVNASTSDEKFTSITQAASDEEFSSADALLLSADCDVHEQKSRFALGSVSPLAVGAAVVGVVGGGRSWAEKVDTALGSERVVEFSRAGRLARRVRRRFATGRFRTPRTGF
jgi:hypothetical protein